MADNRRIKGRSQGLAMLLEGIFGALGSDVKANPEYTTATDAIDKGFVAKGAEENAVRSGAQNKPYKSGNIFAKQNANEMNADYQGAEMALKQRVN
jgi:hypothetical protein